MTHLKSFGIHETKNTVATGIEMFRKMLDEAQADTEEAKWLEENCYKYGFILRYPPDKISETGIIYESWHYRYVGKEDAKKIMDSGVTLEEYLGETY